MDQLDIIDKHAQRHFCDAIYKNLLADVLADAADDDRARLLSCGGPRADAWLNCIPKIPLFSMGSADFRACLRLRLGMELPSIRPTCRCKCGTFPDASGLHYLTCSAGDQLKTRHEVVIKAAHEMVAAAGKHSEMIHYCI